VASTTIGIDLSAQSKKTAVCALAWGDTSARISHIGVGADNQVLIELIATHAPTKVAIDAPFGWPKPFIRALTDFTDSGRWPSGRERRPLLLRTTDLLVKDQTGRDPLSVSSDRLAICAMRCAELLVELAGDSELDRTGSGLVIEVYPAAALRQWGFDPTGYKGAKPEKVEKRRQLVEEMEAATSRWLELSEEDRELLAASDDIFDAVVSAIVARAAQIGRTLPIPEAHRRIAASEGWIHLPERQPLSTFRAI
jgi:predicted nuclease with RNAse H fold